MFEDKLLLEKLKDNARDNRIELQKKINSLERQAVEQMEVYGEVNLYLETEIKELKEQL